MRAADSEILASRKNLTFLGWERGFGKWFSWCDFVSMGFGCIIDSVRYMWSVSRRIPYENGIFLLELTDSWKWSHVVAL